ncbi:hypothetical protein K466DRAFT_660760 [Polyporus arcularius HHB13444]|uniref:Uncharacterized protein n=1 Tax=Polyporus arcularius HHB13444 TaxID=1314778 RepID=A0A5C3PN36_9APHY|nr:hypothetical protein K466DRAFT_660760 [Polyporus arcularius HHB13444]
MNTHAAGPISLPGFSPPAPGLPPNVHLVVLRRRVPHLFNTPRHRRRSRQTTDGIHFFYMSTSSPLNPTAHDGPAEPLAVIQGWIRELKRAPLGTTLPTPVSGNIIIAHIRSTYVDSNGARGDALRGNIKLLRELYEAANVYIDPTSVDGQNAKLRLNRRTEDGIGYPQIIAANTHTCLIHFKDPVKDLCLAFAEIVQALEKLVPHDHLTGQADEFYRAELYELVYGILAGMSYYTGNMSVSMLGDESERRRAREGFAAEAAANLNQTSDWTSFDDSGSGGPLDLQQFQQALVAPPPLRAPPGESSDATSDAERPQSAPPHLPPSVPPSSKPPSESGSIRSSDFSESRFQAQSSPRRSLAPLNSNQTRARSHSPRPAANVADGALVRTRKGSSRSSKSGSGPGPADSNAAVLALRLQHYKELTQKERDNVVLKEELARVREVMGQKLDSTIALKESEVAAVTALLEKEVKEREKDQREREREQRERERERAMMEQQIASLTALTTALNTRLEEGDRERKELTKDLMNALRESAKARNTP